ncbi:hypothetical protein [Nocardia salmonicida]
MSDTSFMTVTTSAHDNTFNVRYSEAVGMVLVNLGWGDLFLTPVDAAEVAEKITAALDVYASMLRAVA